MRIAVPCALVAIVLSALGAAACSNKVDGTLQIVFGTTADGGAMDPLTQSPPVAELVVQAYDYTADGGGVQTLATASLPASTIDLGSLDQSAVDLFTITGYEADGGAVAVGATLPTSLAVLGGVTQEVFVQRTEQMAIMPGTFSDARQSPVLAVLGGQFLFVSGADTSTQLYNLASYAAAPNPPTLPIVPQSVALPQCSSSVSSTVCYVAWLFDQTIGYYFDFTGTNAASAFTLPSAGGGFADIAGGLTVADSLGNLYVVGGTARSGPSMFVLMIDPSTTSNASYPYGYPSWLTLSEKRQGASATWVDGYGLVVAGGSSNPPGFEVVGGSALSCEPAAIATSGAGAAVLPDGQHVLLGGGVTNGQDAGVIVIDLATCDQVFWTHLPVALAAAQSFAIDSTDAVVVGSEISGATHVFVVNESGFTEIPTVVLHANAQVYPSPLSAVDPGSFLLFGGADVLESFAAPLASQ